MPLFCARSGAWPSDFACAKYFIQKFSESYLFYRFTILHPRARVFVLLFLSLRAAAWRWAHERLSIIALYHSIIGTQTGALSVDRQDVLQRCRRRASVLRPRRHTHTHTRARAHTHDRISLPPLTQRGDRISLPPSTLLSLFSRLYRYVVRNM